MKVDIKPIEALRPFQVTLLKMMFGCIKFAFTVSRQSGKSFLLRALLIDALFNFKKENPTIVLLLPTVAQGNEIYVSAIKHIFREVPSDIFNVVGSNSSLGLLLSY